MLSIQDLGLSIMGDSPKNLYILGGCEFGIKEKYIDILCSKIGPRVEMSSFLKLIDMMSVNHIIPLQPKVYVIRYDKEFLSKINDKVLALYKKCKIVGAAILIYEVHTEVTKLDKYFPDNTCEVDNVSPKFIKKYILQEFPDINNHYVDTVLKYSSDYYNVRNVCRALYCIQDKYSLSESDIISNFALSNAFSDNDIQLAIANRDYRSLIYMIDNYSGNTQNILYLILKTMIELDKISENKYSDSPLKSAIKKWDRYSIYNMFNITYHTLVQMRKGYTINTENEISNVLFMLTFKNIPTLEDVL